MHDFKNENIMRNIKNHHPQAHFINIISSSLLFGNEETLVALLDYSSFVRVATSGFRIIPYSLVVVVVCAQVRSDSGIRPYSPQHGIVRVVIVTSPDQ